MVEVFDTVIEQGSSRKSPPGGAQTATGGPEGYLEQTSASGNRRTPSIYRKEPSHERIGPLTIGIDTGKDSLDVAIIPTGALHRVTNDETSHTQLLTLLQEAGATVRIARVVLEATGGYERAASFALADAGLPVVVNPRQTRDFARASGILAKTDRLDAMSLAQFGRALQPVARALRRIAPGGRLFAGVTSDPETALACRLPREASRHPS